MPPRLAGPCPFARSASALALGSLLGLPMLREANGTSVGLAGLLSSAFDGSASGLHPTSAMLLFGVATAAAALASSCPRRAWRAALVGAAGLAGIVLWGANPREAQSAPATGLYLALASLLMATAAAARRSRFVAPEPAPDPRDEVGDPRIDRSAGPDSDPDEIREIAEMTERISA
jgi:hypothetical protein